MSRHRSTGLNTVIPAEIGAAYKKADARISIKCILLYIYKTTRVQKSVHRCFFFSFLFFVGRSILCKFISHNCSKQSLRWEQRAEGSWRAYNHTLQPGFPPQAWGGGNNNKKKKKNGNILAESTISTGFGLSWPPCPTPNQQTHFVLQYGLLLWVFLFIYFCHHNNSVQQ